MGNMSLELKNTFLPTTKQNSVTTIQVVISVCMEKDANLYMAKLGIQSLETEKYYKCMVMILR